MDDIKVTVHGKSVSEDCLSAKTGTDRKNLSNEELDGMAFWLGFP
jgi:hypothetical protein